MGYYMGDARGDFWSGLGKGIKRVARDIGRVAKSVAPVAALVLPGVGAATLVGRGVALAGNVKRAKDAAQAAVNGALGYQALPPMPVPTLSVTSVAPAPMLPGQSMFANAVAATPARRAPRRRKRRTTRRTMRRTTRRKRRTTTRRR